MANPKPVVLVGRVKATMFSNEGVDMTVKFGHFEDELVEVSIMSTDKSQEHTMLRQLEKMKGRNVSIVIEVSP